MGRTCSTYGERRDAYRVLVGNFKEGDHLEDRDIDGKVLLKWIFEKWVAGMDWIDLAQESVRWPALVNAVMNLRFP
jgi:hypothetical protein